MLFQDREINVTFRTDSPLIFIHFWNALYLLFPPHFPPPYFNISLPVLVSGHLFASRGVWDDHSYWGHHRKPVLPGQQRVAESVQGSGPGKAVGGSGWLDSASGCRLSRTARFE